MSRCLLIISSLLLWACSPKQPANDDLNIDVWYGSEQSFGHVGNAQAQINVLGNVKAEKGLKRLSFQLNDDTVSRKLSWGINKHRLALEGDFNVEIYRTELLEGENRIKITAIDSAANRAEEEVVIQYTGQNTWPLPYKVVWSEVSNIQDVVQIIDGNWELTENGVKVVDRYYDRVLGIGDGSWTDYEFETSVIFHSVSPLHPDPPIYNVCHVALASRWPGHDNDKRQPNRKWFPLGATAEFTVSEQLDSCAWRVFDGEHIYVADTINARSIEFEKKYRLKHRVKTEADGSTRYQVKFWDAEIDEPEAWDLEGVEPPGNLKSGSALLLAHNTEVTFGDIYARPIE